MRHTFYISFLFFFLLSCGTEMGLKLENEDKRNVILYIDDFPNFQYNFSTEPALVGEHKYNSLLDYDKELFNFLKSNTSNESVCRVFKLNEQIDKYGKTSSYYVELNSIDLDELRKYESAEYWSRGTCGIKYVKYGECDFLDSDESVNIDSEPDTCDLRGYVHTDKLEIKNGLTWGDNNYNNQDKIFKEAYYKGQLFDGKSANCMEGQITQVIEFKNGLVHGKVIYYGENGKIKEMIEYKNGKEDGVWIEFDSKGDTVTKSIFENGVEVKVF